MRVEHADPAFADGAQIPSSGCDGMPSLRTTINVEPGACNCRATSNATGTPPRVGVRAPPGVPERNGASRAASKLTRLDGGRENAGSRRGGAVSVRLRRQVSSVSALRSLERARRLHRAPERRGLRGRRLPNVRGTAVRSFRPARRGSPRRVPLSHVVALDHQSITDLRLHGVAPSTLSCTTQHLPPHPSAKREPNVPPVRRGPRTIAPGAGIGGQPLTPDAGRDFRPWRDDATTSRIAACAAN